MKSINNTLRCFKCGRLLVNISGYDFCLGCKLAYIYDDTNNELVLSKFEIREEK